MQACALGYEDVVTLLLEARANPLRKDRRHWTPLCHALAAGELGIAHKLFEVFPENQKAIVHGLRDQILEECMDNDDESAADAVRRELGAGGFLFVGPRKV